MRPHVLVLCLCVVLTLWSLFSDAVTEDGYSSSEVRVMNFEGESIWKESVVYLFGRLSERSNFRQATRQDT